MEGRPKSILPMLASIAAMAARLPSMSLFSAPAWRSNSGKSGRSYRFNPRGVSYPQRCYPRNPKQVAQMNAMHDAWLSRFKQIKKQLRGDAHVHSSTAPAS